MEASSHNGATPTPREISLLQVANVLLRHRRLLVVLPLLLAGVFGALALSQGRAFSASAAFIPQTPASAGGTAANLARQLGMDVGTSRPGQSPEFYAQLLRGREIQRKAVESEYVVRRNDAEVRGNLIELWGIEPTRLQPAWRSAADLLNGRMSTSVDRVTGVVEVAVIAETGDLAEQIVHRLVELLNEFNLETRQSQAREEGRFVTERLDEANRELQQTEEALQVFLRQNRQFQNSPELVFEHDRLQRQVGMRQDLVTSLAQSREQARIEGVRDTPLLTVVADPEGSAVPEPRGTVTRTMLGFFLGLMFGVFLAFAREFLRRSRVEDGDEYHEFSRLKREAWADVRRPHRMLSRGKTGTGTVAE